MGLSALKKGFDKHGRRWHRMMGGLVDARGSALALQAMQATHGRGGGVCGLHLLLQAGLQQGFCLIDHDRGFALSMPGGAGL